MNENLRQRAERKVDAKIKFYRNIKSYIIVNAILAIINGLFTPDFWWVSFPVFFWGIGVMADFLKAFILTDDYDSKSYREEKIKEEMEKMRV